MIHNHSQKNMATSDATAQYHNNYNLQTIIRINGILQKRGNITHASSFLALTYIVI